MVVGLTAEGCPRAGGDAVQKDKVEKMLAALPEEVDVDALVERLYLLNKIEIAEERLSRGEGSEPGARAECRVDHFDGV
jgi:hypothetical protein